MQTDMSLSESQSLTGRILAWIGVVSALLSIIVMGLNAYWSYRNSEKADELEQRRLNLRNQEFALSEGKERMARYAFVHGLFSSVLNEKDQGHRTLAVNLINLALTETEATKLFSGLQASADNRMQQLGNVGSDLVAMIDLIANMDAAVKESRLEAVDSLIKNYRADSRAVTHALSVLEMPKVSRLSASGRINALVFLSNTEETAWTSALVARANDAISAMRQRHGNKTAVIGQQSEDALSAFTNHIATMKSK
jgi:hypothetical protein